MSYIFWGFFLLVINFSLDLPHSTPQIPAYFDLFPDFLGYALIALGFGQLDDLTGRRSSTHLLGWLVAILSFVWTMLNAMGRYTTLTPLSILVFLGFTGLHLLIAWLIVRKVADLELRSARDFYSRPLLMAWFVELLGIASASVLRWIVPQLASVTNLIGIVAGLLYLINLWKAKDQIQIYYDSPPLYEK